MLQLSSLLDLNFSFLKTYYTNVANFNSRTFHRRIEYSQQRLPSNILISIHNIKFFRTQLQRLPITTLLRYGIWLFWVLILLMQPK